MSVLYRLVEKGSNMHALQHAENKLHGHMYMYIIIVFNISKLMRTLDTYTTSSSLACLSCSLRLCEVIMVYSVHAVQKN